MDVVSYGFAFFVLSGGIMGYIKAGSIMSLGSALVFGGLIGYGAYRTSANPKDFMFLLGVSGVLMGVMGYRYFITHKFMPAGLLAILSLAQVIRLSMRFNM